MKGIKDRVAVITGGASGIGAGLVHAFVAAGAKVAFADIQKEAGEAIANQIGSRCLFTPADLRRDADIDRIVESAIASFGGIDFLVNAAATYADQGFDSDRAMWQNGFDTNVFGHVMLARRAHEHLQLSLWPSITYFSSEAAHVGLTGRWIYPATKAAIEQVVRSQALDLAADRIRVNAVMPGWTEKPWHKTAPQEVRDRYADMSNRLHMIGRQGTLQEVADAVLFLCSEHAGFITGSCLRVDGGHSALGPQGKEKHLPTAARKDAGVAYQADVK
jgi:NAD(P)-dependent dehydrogenase (short-subunit alcohol dehydrogenase family)